MNTDSWLSIPHAIYDIFARIIPGTVAVGLTVFVVFGLHGTMDFLQRFQTALSAFGMLGVVAVISMLIFFYVAGYVLSQLWILTFGKLLKHKEKEIEEQCRKTCLAEHNRAQRALGNEKLTITVSDLPRPFVMRDHLRLTCPGEVDRLLKLRAEMRFANILVVVSIGLGIVNFILMVSRGTIEERWAIQAILLAITIASIRKSYSTLRNLTNGTTILWLMHASLNKLPLQHETKSVDTTAINLESS